ncbi:MAG: hypothetical protein RJA98_4164 [Pseudomonadota bacterium]|jgi:hypothetical protein
MTGTDVDKWAWRAVLVGGLGVALGLTLLKQGDAGLGWGLTGVAGVAVLAGVIALAIRMTKKGQRL